MKKTIFRALTIITFILFQLPGLNAQNVGISDVSFTPNSQSILDLSSDRKGFLIPRVTLNSNTDPINGSKPEGLMVYNQGGSIGVNGFYYWTGSAWISISTTTGTIAGSGTLNYVPKFTPDGTTIGNSSIFDNGNVGINTTSPSTKLMIHTGTNSSTLTDYTQAIGNGHGMLFSSSYTDGNYNPGLFWSTNNNNPTKPKAGIFLQLSSAGSKMLFSTSTDYPAGLTNTAMVIDDLGQIGIGTTSPSSMLHIKGGGYPQLKVEQASNHSIIDIIGGGTYEEGIRFYHGGAHQWEIYTIGGDQKLRFYGGGGDKIIFDANGNIGIGSSSPGKKLDVVGSIRTVNSGEELDFNSDGNNPSIEMRDTDGSGLTPFIDFSNDGAIDYDGRIRLTGDDYLAVEGANLGIGVTAPAEVLDVNGKMRMRSGAVSGYVPVSDANGSMTWTDPTTVTTANDGDWTISGSNQYSTVSGNVGIGSTSPGYKLDVYHASGIRIGDPANAYRANLVFGQPNAWNSGIRTYDNGDAEMRIWHENANGQIVMATGYNGEIATSMPTDGLFLDQNKVGIGYASPGSSTGKLMVNGNVGIGSNNPGYKLDVLGGGLTARFDQNGSLAWTSGINISGPGSSTYIFNEDATNGYTRFRNTNTGQYAFTNPSGTNVILLHGNGGDSYFNSGNVAIGSSSANGYKLDVNGTTNIRSNNWLSNNGIPAIRYSYFGYSSGYPGIQIGSGTANRGLFLQYDPTGNTSGQFSNGREIVIGNNIPILAPVAANNNYRHVMTYGSDNKLHIGSQGTYASYAMNIDDAGNVGVNATSPVARLQVGGSLIAGGIDNGSVIFYRSSNPYSVGGTDAVVTASDRSGADWGFLSDKTSYDYGMRINVGSGAEYALAVYDGSSYNTRIRGNGSAIFSNFVEVGSKGSSFGSDQGGNIELGASNSIANTTSAVPYIDFHYGVGSAQDYNIRMINDKNQGISFSSSGYSLGTFGPDALGSSLAPGSGVRGDFWLYAVYSYWRGYWLDVMNDLDAIDNIKPVSVYNEKLGRYVSEIDPTSLPEVITEKGHGIDTDEPGGGAINLTSGLGLAWGGIRQLRAETKTSDAALESRIERLEKIVEELTGEKLGNINFERNAKAYKGMESLVIVDARITADTKININGLSNYQILNQGNGSFTIKFTSPVEADVEFTYSGVY